MILGIVTAVVFALVAAAAFTKRLPQGSWLTRALRAAHRPLGYLLLALSAAHLILALKLIHQRPPIMLAAGFAMFGCALFSCFSRALFTKNAKRGLLLHRLSGLILALLLAVHIAFGVGSLISYQREMAAVSISNVSVKNLPDGIYEGICDVGYIKARVSVTIVDGRMTKIELLEHRNERGAAGEGVIARMLEAQSTQVDTVSGATNSSRVIQKAVENALEQP